MYIEQALAGLGQLGELDQATAMAAARSVLARIMKLYDQIAPSASVPAFADANKYLQLGRQQALTAIDRLGLPYVPPFLVTQALTLVNNANQNLLAATKIVKDIQASADEPPPAPTHDPLPKMNGGAPPPVVQAGLDLKTVLPLALLAFFMMQRKG